MPAQASAPGRGQAEFLRELFEARLLIDTGVAGVYGHSDAFEQIRERVAAVLAELARERGAVKLTFPPVISQRNLETTGYVGNFPHLVGSIYGFDGTEADAVALRSRATAHEDWSEFQSPTNMMLLPAACYPVYPAIAERGPLQPEGIFIDMGGTWVFRHEPSEDPARRQMFRQHELVRIGSPDTVTAWRVEWAQLGLELMQELGLEAEIENASDPFFGRHGRLLAASQSAEALKWELVVPIASPTPTACASFNYHVDRFARTWGLELADGGEVHTACAGFGQERITLALLRRHGLECGRWPGAVRERLGMPSG